MFNDDLVTRIGLGIGQMFPKMYNVKWKRTMIKIAIYAGLLIIAFCLGKYS